MFGTTVKAKIIRINKELFKGSHSISTERIEKMNYSPFWAVFVNLTKKKFKRNRGSTNNSNNLFLTYSAY